MTSNLFIESDAEMYRYSLAFGRLRAMALAPQGIDVVHRLAGRPDLQRPFRHGRGSAVMKANLSGADWRKSRYSGSGSNCVEITVTTDTSGWPHKAGAEKLYLMRDSKKPDGPVLAFTPAEWEAFVLGVKDGEFDLADGEFQN